MESKKTTGKSPYLEAHIPLDGVSVPMGKPDYDFEGAVSGFDYADPNIYASAVDPDFSGSFGTSAEGIYDNQYSLGGSILDALLEDQADTLEPSAVIDNSKLKEEVKKAKAKRVSRGVQSSSSIKEGIGQIATPMNVAIFIAFSLGFLLPKVLK
tara:strand:+ start:2326 stop:2787 length:462 start_codon:yes stop_codon:yes gene_type:complete